MSQLATLQEDKAQYQEQLDIVLSSLKDDPENAELLGLKAELDAAIQMIDDSIAELKPKREPAKPAVAAHKAASPTPPVQEKWSRESHPALKKSGGAAAEEREKEQQGQDHVAPVSYQVNDTVLAKWVSGDKGFYTARITSVTGSSTAPMYTVKFKSYDTVETLRAKDLRPVSATPAASAQKRKADGTPISTHTSSSSSSPNIAAATAPQPAASRSLSPTVPGASKTNNGVVLSAAASLYPQARQPGQEEGAQPGKEGADGNPPKKFKKIKATKELEAGKSKWQDFNAKSKFAKSHKKDSMFRTPDGIHGRVGFTGSGQAMRKDPTRSRHVYQANEELD